MWHQSLFPVTSVRQSTLQASYAVFAWPDHLRTHMVEGSEGVRPALDMPASGQPVEQQSIDPVLRALLYEAQLVRRAAVKRRQGSGRTATARPFDVTFHPIAPPPTPYYRTPQVPASLPCQKSSLQACSCTLLLCRITARRHTLFIMHWVVKHLGPIAHSEELHQDMLDLHAWAHRRRHWRLRHHCRPLEVA